MCADRTTRRGRSSSSGGHARGCSDVIGGVDRLLTARHTHNRDALIEEMTGAWPTRGATVERIGATDGRPPGPGAPVRKIADLGEHFSRQPVVDADRLYAGVSEADIDGETFSGTLALERENPQQVAWRNEGDGAVATAARGRVLFESRDGQVQAVDATDGSVFWRTRVGNGVAVPVGDTVFTSGETADVALDAVTGEHRWSSEVDFPTLEPVAVAEAADALLLTFGNGGGGALYCLERANGDVRWRYDAVGESYAMPVTDGRRAYAVGTEGSLHAVDIDIGEGRWSHRFRRESYQRPAVADGTVYATGTNDDTLVALDAASGNQVWQVPLDVGVEPSPTVAGDHVLLQGSLEDDENTLHVFDRETGFHRHGFQYPRERPAREFVQPVVADGAAYVVGADSQKDYVALYEIRG